MEYNPSLSAARPLGAIKHDPFRRRNNEFLRYYNYRDLCMATATTKLPIRLARLTLYSGPNCSLCDVNIPHLPALQP